MRATTEVRLQQIPAQRVLDPSSDASQCRGECSYSIMAHVADGNSGLKRVRCREVVLVEHVVESQQNLIPTVEHPACGVRSSRLTCSAALRSSGPSRWTVRGREASILDLAIGSCQPLRRRCELALRGSQLLRELGERTFRSFRSLTLLGCPLPRCGFQRAALPRLWRRRPLSAHGRDRPSPARPGVPAPRAGRLRPPMVALALAHGSQERRGGRPPALPPSVEPPFPALLAEAEGRTQQARAGGPQTPVPRGARGPRRRPQVSQPRSGTSGERQLDHHSPVV